MNDVAIAVDLGGTNLRCSVVDREGNLRHESRQSSGADEGPERIIPRIARMIEGVAVEASLSDEVAVGIVAPGPLNTSTGVVHYAPNLDNWHDVPIRDRLEELCGREIILGNDANATALGEYYFGAARGVKDMVFIAIGTGFGGGVIAEGRLIDGPHGLGGELGHTTISMTGPRCTCGAIGCVEAYCSGWAIARDAEAVVRSGRSEKIRQAAGERPIDARAVNAAADAGDEAALRIYEDAGHALGVAMANFVNIFNPELIVMGGGLSRAGELLMAPARRALNSYAMTDLRKAVTIQPSALGTKTGTYGAAALVFYHKQI